MRGGLDVFYIFRGFSNLDGGSRENPVAEFIMWSPRVPALESGSTYAVMFNKGIPPGHSARFEFCGHLYALPDGKTFDTPDKVLSTLKFWIIRRLRDQ